VHLYCLLFSEVTKDFDHMKKHALLVAIIYRCFSATENSQMPNKHSLLPFNASYCNL